jgi:hypothetical protein
LQSLLTKKLPKKVITAFIHTNLGFEELKIQLTGVVEKIQQQVEKKSNLKDVCALLDLKSSKFPFACSQFQILKT